MRVAYAIALLTLVGSLGFISTARVSTALAGEPTQRQVQSIELIGAGDARFVIDGRPYLGPIKVTAYDDGITLTETSSIEQYLDGIAEMPFAWPIEALRAQAVASRTYLARRLLPGRRGDAAAHDYDICATNRCQVYRGVQLVERQGGDRWRQAVEDTSGEVVLYNGRPIEAVFTSMVGSRSRSNQDVWSSDPVPYLQAVDSPEVGIAPYAQWTVEVTADQFVAILAAGGLDVGGSLKGIVVDDPPEGEGRTKITVRTTEGTDSILAPRLKGVFNREGDELYPGVLPMRLADGRQLPEPLLSYTFEIIREVTTASPIDALLPESDRTGEDRVVFLGEGWGHGVGMSQWGARIMADSGEIYSDILSHYYSGLRPQQAPDVVPTAVVVGLDTDRVEVMVTVSGGAEVLVNGVAAGFLFNGAWVVRDSPNGLDLVPLNGSGNASPISNRFWPR